MRHRRHRLHVTIHVADSDARATWGNEPFAFVTAPYPAAVGSAPLAAGTRVIDPEPLSLPPTQPLAVDAGPAPSTSPPSDADGEPTPEDSSPSREHGGRTVAAPLFTPKGLDRGSRGAWPNDPGA